MNLALRSTRIYRVLQIIMVLIIPCAFATRANIKVLILAICCALIYSAAGIHNAVKDRDYDIPTGFSTVMIFLLVAVAIFFSLSDRIIFWATLAWIFLGYVYNSFSRFILFGDSTILTITHSVIPCFAGSLLVGLDMSLAIKLTFFLASIYWFIIQVKNLKDTKEDKIRGYKTLTTIVYSGKAITIIFLVIAFLLFFIYYFLFPFSTEFLAIHLAVIMLQAFTLYLIMKDINQSAVDLSRLLMMLFLLGIIIAQSPDLLLTFISVILFLIYLLMFTIKKIPNEGQMILYGHVTTE